MSDLKDILHAVFSEAAPKAYGGYWQGVSTDTSSDHYDLGGSVNADLLAQAITDHVLNPERVRAALHSAFERAGLDCDFLLYDIRRDVAKTVVTYKADGSVESFRTEFNENVVPAAQSIVLIETLIEALAGKVGEQ